VRLAKQGHTLSFIICVRFHLIAVMVLADPQCASARHFSPFNPAILIAPTPIFSPLLSSPLPVNNGYSLSNQSLTPFQSPPKQTIKQEYVKLITRHSIPRPPFPSSPVINTTKNAQYDDQENNAQTARKDHERFPATIFIVVFF
jgi:hypothetical protein